MGRSGHLLIIHKALYGLGSPGREFGGLLAECLKKLDSIPSKAEPEIFMRRNGGIYEYIATYVDDLCLVMEGPGTSLKVLQQDPHNSKLEGGLDP